MMSLILPAVSLSLSKSSPKSLSEFSPFTPDIASSTLSWMFCEKPKSTPGYLEQLLRICWMSRPWRRRGPLVWRFQLNEELGIVEGDDVGAIIGTVRLVRRRCVTSGKLSKIPRTSSCEIG